LAQHGAALGLIQHLQGMDVAPTQAGAQIVAQLEVSWRQTARSQHPARQAHARREGVDKPVESGVLLLRVVQMHIVHQDRHPIVVELGWVHGVGIQPSHLGALLLESVVHRLQQMGLA
jgi:hypothetical protein